MSGCIIRFSASTRHEADVKAYEEYGDALDESLDAKEYETYCSANPIPRCNGDRR